MDTVIEGVEEFSVALSIAADGESFANVSDGQARVVIERDPRMCGIGVMGRGGNKERGKEGSMEGMIKARHKMP